MSGPDQSASDESPPPPVPDEAAIEKRIQILLESTRLERDRAADRVNGTQTRATILIGAAGVLGGVEALGPGASGLSTASVVVYVSAALVGIVILWPLRVRSVSNAKYFRTMMNYHPIDLQESLLRNELQAVAHTQARLAFRSWALIAGFGLLGLAWILSFLAMTEPPVDMPVRIQIVD